MRAATTALMVMNVLLGALAAGLIVAGIASHRPMIVVADCFTLAVNVGLFAFNYRMRRSL